MSGEAPAPLEAEVPESAAGQRLDQAISALFPELSRRKARQLIERGSVYLDGRRCRVASRLPKPGARLRVHAGAPVAGGLSELCVLWEGAGLVALDKAPGVPVAPTRASAVGTLLHALARRSGCSLREIHPVHRLDTPTSGVVLVALDARAAGLLGRALQEGRVRKTYMARVAGRPEHESGEWSWPLLEGSPGFVRVDGRGKPAVTRYRVVRGEGGTALLELEPVTGRTHQLRVHAARAGCPILGDRKYGGPPAPRLMLHAWRIAFPLPSGGEKTVESPLPTGFKGDPR